MNWGAFSATIERTGRSPRSGEGLDHVLNDVERQASADRHRGPLQANRLGVTWGRLDRPGLQMAGAEHDEMTCRELVQVVTDYPEGTLPEADRVLLEAHLVTCLYWRRTVP
jgi:Putative zinc-finger